MEQVVRRCFTIVNYSVTFVLINTSETGAGGVITSQITQGSVSPCFYEHLIFPIYRLTNKYKIFHLYLMLLNLWK